MAVTSGLTAVFTQARSGGGSATSGCARSTPAPSVVEMRCKLQCTMLNPGIARETHFFNKLFGIYA
jgi:hypothetical protein